MRAPQLNYASPPAAPVCAQELDASASAAITIAAVAVGLAIHWRDGEYTLISLLLVTEALIAMGIAVCARWRWLPDGRWLVWVLYTCILIQFVELFTKSPGVDLRYRGERQLLPFYSGLMASIMLLLWCRLSSLHCNVGRALPATRKPGGQCPPYVEVQAGKPAPQHVSGSAGTSPARTFLGAGWFPLLLATHLLLGCWMVHSSPRPHIDVWVFQQDAAKELLKGHNPYAMTFPDIYHSTFPGYRQEVYGKGLVANDRLQFGFPYPPVSLFLATIGYAIAHDHRYAQAAALVLAGAFIGYSRAGLIAKLAAAMLLFTPRVFFVVGRAWTEPFTLLLMAATVFLACRRPRLLPLGLGLLIATKQYMILAIPISFFLLPSGWRWREWIGLLWKSAVVACIVTLPLALCDWQAFWKSTVTVQQLAPFRWDALSYLVWYGFRGHLVTAPFTAAFWSSLAALVALALSLWRSPRTPAGFAASLAFISLAFFSFNKQAFCNYYFFVIGAMCCAIGAATVHCVPSHAEHQSSQPTGH